MENYKSRHSGAEIDNGIDNALREATVDLNGLMSASDKQKIDILEIPKVGCIENLARYEDGLPSNSIIDTRHASENYIQKDLLPLSETMLTNLRAGDKITVGFDTDFYNCVIPPGYLATDSLPVVAMRFVYDDGTSQTFKFTPTTPEGVNFSGVYPVSYSFSLKSDVNLTSALTESSATVKTPYLQSGEGAYIRLFNLRIYRGEVDYGWTESTTYLTESIGDITDALTTINGPGKPSYYHVGTNTAAYYDLGEPFDGTNKYIEFDMEMAEGAADVYSPVFGIRNLNEAGQNYLWAITMLETPTLLFVNYADVPMGEKVTFRFKGLELFANDISLGAGAEYPPSTIESAYLFSFHDVGDSRPLYMLNLFKLYDVRIYSMDGTLLNNYEPQADQSRKCSVTGKVLEKLGDGYFDVVKY